MDEQILTTKSHISLLEKNFIEFKLNYSKQSIEEVLIQRAVKTTFQILYDKGLFDNNNNADEVLNDLLFTTQKPDSAKNK